MLADTLSWNLLNLIRVELFFNLYKLTKLYFDSSLQSPLGHYAIASFIISLFAHLAFQFQLTLILPLYAMYLGVGMVAWLNKRVFLYHRRLNSEEEVSARQRELDDEIRGRYVVGPDTSHPALTLKHKDKNGSHPNGTNGTTSSSASSSTNHNEPTVTNSLNRQRAKSYQNFRSVLSKPCYNPKDFALSLSHLSSISKILSPKNAFDEVHLQCLATRDDVINFVLRVILISGTILLAYIK